MEITSCVVGLEATIILPINTACHVTQIWREMCRRHLLYLLLQRWYCRIEDIPSVPYVLLGLCFGLGHG